MNVAATATRRIPLPGTGPEDVVMDQEGYLITGVDDGRILRVDPHSGEVHELANTGGRPLGLEVLPGGNILICDSPRGLLQLDPRTGELRVLVNSHDGHALPFCSNAVAASDGSIYFSTSSARYTIHEWRYDIVENIPSGALFRRNPDGRVECLLDGLQFANGLALATDESFIIIAETAGRQLRRYWLKGSKAGQSQVFAELPGFPDNLSMSADGLIWVAMASSSNPMLAKVHKLPLPLRRLVARLPESLQPAPERVTWVMAFDGQGNLKHNHRWDDGAYAMVTGVCEHGGEVYLGSMIEPALMAFTLPVKSC